jgi:sialate O-acetylesterase
VVYPVADAEDGAAEQAAAHHPLLRLLTFRDTAASAPASDCPSAAPYTWAASSPATLSSHGKGAYPSAACYFGGRDVLAALNNSVPVGLITAAWSGSTIESWMTEAMVRDGTPALLGGNGTCGGTAAPGAGTALGAAMAAEAVAAEAAVAAGAGAGAGAGARGQHGSMFNGMVAPLLPMRLTGIWWYQGEGRR